ncbi:hypothetical protein ABW19_dt0207468 [Dactylella cylindrospora]|nr:hypothetical protein ABW19_dt0207468 [Dactylella cylindrospora]
MEPSPPDINFSASPAALHAVRIPEILTQILYHIPPVLLSTRFRLVCKSWKREIEYGPVLKWQTWVPTRGSTIRRLKCHSSSADITIPPPSIRELYKNRNCLPGCVGVTGKVEGGIAGVCDIHCYTDTFEIHPMALHFLQLFWQRFMRLPIGNALEIVSRNDNDALMDELVALLKPKLREFEQAAQDDPPAVRVCTSNRLFRPETLAANIGLYCGVQNESLIETKLYDNGTLAPFYCNSSRVSSRKMLAVKDLVYNVMHRSFLGDRDILEVKRRRTQKGTHHVMLYEENIKREQELLDKLNQREKEQAQLAEKESQEEGQKVGQSVTGDGEDKGSGKETEENNNGESEKQKNIEETAKEKGEGGDQAENKEVEPYLEANRATWHFKTQRYKIGEEFDYIPEYYSVIVQVEGKTDDTSSNGHRGGMEATEIEITLSLSEPFEIINVTTKPLIHSTNNVKERAIPRYSDMEPGRPTIDSIKKRDWRRWARLKRPKKGDAIPYWADACSELDALLQQKA